MKITRAELRNTINKCLLFPLTEDEFRALMLILDPGHTNIVDCQKFLSLLNTVESDLPSESLNIEDKKEKLDENIRTTLCGEKIRSELKKYFNKNFKTIEKAFNAFDCEETGYMNTTELKKTLDAFCFPLSESQFHEVIKGISVINNKIFYEDFINLYKKSPYEEGEKWIQNVNKLVNKEIKVMEESEFNQMIESIREAVRRYQTCFLKEFKINDSCNTGVAEKEILSKLLQKYVFKVSDEQFEKFWSLLPKTEAGLLKYEEFLNEWSNIKTSSSSQSETTLSDKKSIKKSLSGKTGSDIICSKQRPKTASALISHRKTANSPTKVSVRPKSAAHNMLQKEASLSTNLNDTYKNSEIFLQASGCSVLTHQQYQQYKSLDFRKNMKSTKDANNSVSSCRIFPEDKTAKNFEHEIHFINNLKKRWSDILQQCNAVDSENSHSVPWSDFIDILHKFGLDVNKELEKILEVKYNIKKNLPVNYWTFFKKLLLSDSEISQFKSKNNMALSGRPSMDLYKVFLKYREKVLQNYRDLYHAFRKADHQRSGRLSFLEFRRILAHHKIYISEDDFFFLLDYFDPELSGKLRYKSFLSVYKE
ncbi:EF-hand calcium-binding domain-containing protein 6-like isoform X2 [Stegodyphus dumicola]|nr:EF-hand calcium-binding domain-containing protein 6-like isoform X2 [Stegodyphus dumicola]